MDELDSESCPTLCPDLVSIDHVSLALTARPS